MQLSLAQQTGRAPLLSELALLRPMDRIIVEHDGRPRVAKVASHYNRSGVRKLCVWLKKQNGVGFCHSKTTVRCRDVVDVTCSSRLHVDAADDERSLVADLTATS